ncbi:MAG: PAS domain-containing protein [Planctomycetes bacterium]|nr:PAS domain-containing protein [Planctomycetota bacterium]
MNVGDVPMSLSVAARQVSLLRLLLLAVALGVLTQGLPDNADTVDIRRYLGWLVLLVAASAAILATTVRWVRARWQLALQLVFDLIWTGLLVYFSGGVASPAVVMLFAVILTGTLALPGAAPFVMPALASLALAGSGMLYLAGYHPLGAEAIENNPVLSNVNALLSVVGVQIAALFLVDILGQLLARRWHEQRLFTGELLDQLGEGVLAVDRHGIIAYANAEAMRLLDLPPGGAQGRKASELLAHPTLKPVAELLEDDDLPALRRFDDANGRQLVLRLTALSDRRGRPLGRTLLVADETRLRVLEEGAQRSAHLAALGEMAAGIAHEVRNPLTSLRGCAQELADLNMRDGNRDGADLAKIMIDEADRLARIVEDFLSLSRMRTPRREDIRVEQVLSDLRELYQRREDLRPGALVFVVDPDTPSAFVDADQFRQALINLINNSIEALRGSAGSSITVTARAAPSGNPLGSAAIEITVADNGPGIPAELLNRIFTPFFSTKSRGTGLGLSLVQRIVRDHEGLVRIDSAPGKGTAVVLLLPAHSQTRTFVRALGGR